MDSLPDFSYRGIGQLFSPNVFKRSANVLLIEQEIISCKFVAAVVVTDGPGFVWLQRSASTTSLFIISWGQKKKCSFGLLDKIVSEWHKASSAREFYISRCACKLWWHDYMMFCVLLDGHDGRLANHFLQSCPCVVSGRRVFEGTCQSWLRKERGGTCCRKCLIFVALWWDVPDAFAVLSLGYMTPFLLLYYYLFFVPNIHNLVENQAKSCVVG